MAAAAGGVGVRHECPWPWESGKVLGSATLFSLCTELTWKLMEWVTGNLAGFITPDRAPDGHRAPGPCLLTALISWHSALVPWTPDTPEALFFGPPRVTFLSISWPAPPIPSVSSSSHFAASFPLNSKSLLCGSPLTFCTGLGYCEHAKTASFLSNTSHNCN